MNTSQAPEGRYYEINGRRIWMRSSGDGGPAVVFLPGASAFGLDYRNIHERVGAFTTSVIYDRGGTGWSDPVDLPRTAEEVATELRELLRVAAVPGPYVLVAHSLGGAYARRFAQLFPEQVAGIVSLDAFHEDWNDFMPPKLHLRAQPVPGTFLLKLVTWFARGLYRRMLATWPEQVREPLIARHLTVASQRAGARERSNQPDLGAEVKAGGPLPDVPLIAVTALSVDAGQRLFMGKDAMAEMLAGKSKLDAALAASVSNGEHRELADARHSTMVVDCADAVTQAVTDLWQRAR